MNDRPSRFPKSHQQDSFGDASKLRQENAKLKEDLKNAKDMLEIYREHNGRLEFDQVNDRD